VTDRRAARRRRGSPGFWYRLAALILRRPPMVLTRRDWAGMEHIPEGGAVTVVNHISHVDPLSFAHFLHDAGRLPRFLGKAGLFSVPVVGTILRGAGQIPVYRESDDAAEAYSAAVAAVRAGELVAIYPEATLTRDPDLWPMTGKTGAARIALKTGAPVIPVAQWGPHLVLPGTDGGRRAARGGDRADHGLHHRAARADPGGARAGRTLRPASAGRTASGRPAPQQRRSATSAAAATSTGDGVSSA